MVDTAMVRECSKLKVFRSIICSVSVNMVDVFGWLQRSAEYFLHYLTMLSDSVSAIPNSTVPLVINSAFGVFNPVSSLGMPVNISVARKSGVVHPAKAVGDVFFSASFDFAESHGWILPELLQNVK